MIRHHVCSLFRTARPCVIAALLLVVASVPAASDIVRITIEGPIHPISDEYIGRAIDHATKIKADALLIYLRTPGGLADSTRTIVEKIVSSKVPVIIYVAPSGSQAASAGFFILQAADVAAMAPGTNTGAAHPVALGGKVDDVMKSKMENDAAAWMRSVVAKRGRNVEAAESAVRESKSWSEPEALKLNLIDVIAKDQADLFQQLDGRTIKRFDGSAATLRLVGKQEQVFEMTLKQRILGFLMNPNIAFVLFSIGLLALYAEFNNPGAILPGVIGLIFVLLSAFALNLLPTRFAGVALILAAFILFALEAKFTSHGILGAGGVAAMTLGALLLVDAPIPEMRIKLATALAVSIPLGIITVFLVSIALKARRNKVATGTEGLVGEIGIARTPLSPAGKIFVHGELWDAVSPKPVGVGEQVTVLSVDLESMKLHVEPTTTSEQPATASVG